MPETEFIEPIMGKPDTRQKKTNDSYADGLPDHICNAVFYF